MKTYDTVSNWFMWCLISYIICSKIKSFFKISFSWNMKKMTNKDEILKKLVLNFTQSSFGANSSQMACPNLNHNSFRTLFLWIKLNIGSSQNQLAQFQKFFVFWDCIVSKHMYLECIRSYAWSKGHSDPHLSSVYRVWRVALIVLN